MVSWECISIFLFLAALHLVWKQIEYFSSIEKSNKGKKIWKIYSSGVQWWATVDWRCTCTLTYSMAEQAIHQKPLGSTMQFVQDRNFQ